MTKDTPLQLGFAETYASTSFDRQGRIRKARKVVGILSDAYGELGTLTLLDIGCSTGFMSHEYASSFKYVVAIDVDQPALKFARLNNSAVNLDHLAMDSQNLAFPDASFDAVTCTHIYEHVPDPHALMREIRRVLKPGGACFFSAGNRYSWMEPHYQLPMLSVIPKSWAHHYLRILNKGDYYYETHLSYRRLRELVKDFTLRDYTLDVVKYPETFAAEDMIRPGSLKQHLILMLLRYCYWICPTYLWVLKRE
jgi:2-polyprenyl-3-methyl-5-hydroxy-6-metoxy-1,4-benzoquinol methylase